jgi:integrase
MPKSQWETDPVVRSLAVCTHPSGIKSFVFRHRARGKVFKAALGRVGTLSLEDARRTAQIYVGEIARDLDPIAERKAEAERNLAEIEAARLAKIQVAQEVDFTVRALIRGWTASRGEDDSRSVKYVAAFKRALENALLPVLDSPARELNKDRIEKLIAVVVKSRGPAAANQALFAINAAFRRAIKIGKLEVNPCISLEQRKLSPRERLLTSIEIRRIWRGAGTLPSPLGEYIRFLLATGVRRNEALHARWSEIEDNLLWHIPSNRMKAKRAFTVPLTRAALASLPAKNAGGDFIFSRTDGVRPIGGLTRVKDQLDAAIEADGGGPLAPWTLHHIRHALSTFLADRGIDYQIADLCLAHGIPLGKSGRTYQRSYKITERRAALDLWSDLLDPVPVPEPVRKGRTLRVVK